MAHQLLFERLGGNRFTAAADDVFYPAGDLQIAVVPEADQVAAAVEAVGIEAAFVVALGTEIAIEGVRTPHQEFAFFARGLR